MNDTSKDNQKHTHQYRCTLTWTPILTRNGEGAGTRILRIRCLPLVAFCPWQNRNVEVFLGLVIIAQAKHPAPSRTWQLSAVAPMVLRLKTWESRSLPNLVKPLLNRISLNDNNKTPSGAGWSSPVARQAHNLKVVGSNPTPATIVTDPALAIRGGFVVSDSPNAKIPASSPDSSM